MNFDQISESLSIQKQQEDKVQKDILHIKAYDVDLKNVKTLAQFKLQIEQGLMKKLADGWASYYDAQSMTYTEAGKAMMKTMSYAEAVNSPDLKAISDYETAMKQLSEGLRSTTSAFTGTNVSMSGLTDTTSKSNKETERAIYLQDKYKSATEKLNLELEKQRAIQAKFPEHSMKYQDALKSELKLLEKKKNLLADQAKSLEKQIKSGNIQQTGIIKSSSSSPSGSYSGQYASSINQAASKYGVDPNLIAAIIQVESNFNPKAKSGAGAQGLMQLMPETARELGVKNAYDPHQNIMGGTKYISQQISKFGGDIQKALWAYNAGAGNVSKILNSGNNTWTGVKNCADKVLKIFDGSTNSVADYYLNNFRQTSQFGDTHGRNSPHKGLDFANGRQGDPVKALRGGKVITASYSKSAGNWVVIQQDDGMVAKYMHMQNGLNVKAGQQVKAGDVLGKVGNTGQSTGAHLHLQIEQNGKAIDPLKYLNGMSNGSSYAEQMQSVDSAKSQVLQLQQEILSIENEMQQLYMEIVESQLAAFDRKKQSYEDDLAKIDLIQSRETDTSKEWIKQQGKKEDILNKQIEQDKKAIKFLNEQIKANKNLNQAQKALLEDQLVSRYQELYSLQQKLLDERTSMANQIIDTYKKSAEAQKDAAISAIDKIINGINKEAEEADYKKRLEKSQKDRQEILDQIVELSLDDSFAAKKRISELTKQLQEMDDSIADMQDDKSRNDRIDNLNKEKEKVESDYDNLINDERKFNKMRSDIINANSKEIQKDLEKYYKNIKDNANLLGKSLSNNLIDLINQANRYLNGKNYKPIKIAQAKQGGILPSWGSQGKAMIVHEEEMISNKHDTKNLLEAMSISEKIIKALQGLNLKNLAQTGINYSTPMINQPKIPSFENPAGSEQVINNNVILQIDGNIYGDYHFKKKIEEIASNHILGNIVSGVKIMGARI